MLLQFAVENFKSFADRAILNLAARQAEKMIPGAARPVELPGSGVSKILTAAAIYGANASGKTNLIAALGHMDFAVALSQTDWKVDEPLPFTPHLLRKDEPSFFEVQILSGGVRYTYGFEANTRRFLREWLHSYPVGRERILFERRYNPDSDSYDMEFGNHLSGDKRTLKSINSRVRDNSLFVSAGAQDNQSDCLTIFNWFKEKIRYGDMDIDYSTRSETSIFALNFPKFKNLLIPLMKLSDPSIKDILIKFEGSIEDARSLMSSHESLWEAEEKFDITFIMQDGDEEISVPFAYQSRGVKKLYDFGSLIVNALAFGFTIVVDELEASMHAHVAAKILALFQNSSSNPHGAQIIFTTHETRLLNLQHLRRDQIWFCERIGLRSNLYSLIEFSPRRDENLEFGYLRGRYGAIPRVAIDPSWIAGIREVEAFREIDQ